MGVVLTPPAQSSEVLSLEFVLSNQPTPFAVRAIVRYRRGFTFGLEFLGISSDQLATIDEFCSGLEITES